MKIAKNIKDYEKGDRVKVKIRIGNTSEWRDGTVEYTSEVYWGGGPRHSPYTMVFVNVIRTYWDSIKEEWYDKMNMEGFTYNSDLKLISKKPKKDE